MHLQLEELKRKRTRPAIFETLRSLPGDIEQAYEMVLGRIPDELRETMFRALVLIGFLPESIDLRSVAEAAVMDPMRGTIFDPNWRLFKPAKDILDDLGSFITMRKAWSDDMSPGGSPTSPVATPISTSSSLYITGMATVELAHSSVKEFVSKRWNRITAESYPLPGGCAAVAVTTTDHVYGCCVVYLAHLLRQDCEAFTREEFDEQFPFAYFAQLVPPGGIRHRPSLAMRRKLAPLWAEIFSSPLMLQRWEHLRRYKYFALEKEVWDDSPISLAEQLGLDDIVRALEAEDLERDKESSADRLAMSDAKEQAGKLAGGAWITWRD